MYQTLLIFHSLFRWAVIICLPWAIYRAFIGYRAGKPFTRADNALRHWTATISHIQLMAGMILYTQSPMVKFYFSGEGDTSGEPFFFGLLHIALMLAAIVIITIGSAKAKRQPAAQQKFKTMLLWFSLGFLVMLIAIPWPFSPLAHRPLIRF